MRSTNWGLAPLLAALLAIFLTGAAALSLSDLTDGLRRDSSAGDHSQQYLHTGAATDHYANVSSYAVLSHPGFPRYRVRVKRTEFCDPTVNVFTGYIDIEARHFFFYFFESRDKPDEDDVVMWTNGGPGASASMGLFMELGPCNIAGNNKTVFNPYSWNTKANMLFVDQPVGVGYSYAEYGETVDTTEEAAKDIAAFLAIFFHSVNDLRGRSLHIAGESYAGRYLPLYGAEIYDQNKRLKEIGITPVNLKSVIIGNGMISQYHIISSLYEMQCTSATGAPPIQSISACVRMQQIMPRCLSRYQEHCLDTHDEINCGATISFCMSELYEPFALTGRSFYDMRIPCIGAIQDTLCYPQSKDITTYLNRPAIRATLGIDPAAGAFSMVAWALNAAFDASGDTARPAAAHLAALLDRGVRTLIYAGTHDLACSWVGNEATARALEWAGQGRFNEAPLRAWMVNGSEAGLVRAAGALTFASVWGSGHMVPYDRPQEALALINRWLAEEPL